MATRPQDAFAGPMGGEMDAFAGGLLPPPPGPPAPTSGDPYAKDEEDNNAINKLRPGSELHGETMKKLMAMMKFSERKMSPSYSRFRNQELKVQAYLMSQDNGELVRIIEESKGAVIPEPVNVVVPYSYATLHAAATYISTILLGRKPAFPLSGVRGTSITSARYMENVIQHNLDASMGQERLWQHVWDSLLYGFSPTKVSWEERTGKVMRRGVDGERTFTDELKFAGNTLRTVDPYKFRPDPRVPLSQCHRLGDFMFDIDEVSYTVLKDREARDELKWVKQALAKYKDVSRRRNYESSNRGAVGRAAPEVSPADVIGFAEVCEGTVRLVPKDWKLGDATESQLWRFLFIPDTQILAAAPHGAMHEEHPYAVGEPTSLGHDFLSMSQADMIGVFQDLLSWLVSSRMENVRASIANSYIVDPSRIEMNDMRSSAIGRIIRMKQAAIGLPVNEAIMQLRVNDVTGGHFTDINVIRTLADTATGVNDNLRGIQTGSGRRSATEARITMQAGASRLSQLATRLSGQSFQTLATQMISNIQQWIPDDLWIEFSGDDGEKTSTPVDPNMLVGSFNYQVSDGTLPIDKDALLDQWKEILMGVAQDPELRQNWDINEIFRYIANMAGAKNIDNFKRQQQQPTIAPPGMDPAADGGTPTGGPPLPQLPASLAFQG
jgi:hypothetical protein